MRLNYSKKILILSLVVFASILTLDIIFTNMLLGKIVSINDKIKQSDISSQKREEELILKGLIASSKVEREKLTGYFVGAGNAETVNFTKYLEELALEAGVTQRKSLDYESANELSSSEIVSAIRYRFNVTGKWTNVFYFLQMIENLPKVLSLNNISVSVNPGAVSASEAKSGAKTWSADLDFSVVKLKK